MAQKVLRTVTHHVKLFRSFSVCNSSLISSTLPPCTQPYLPRSKEISSRSYSTKAGPPRPWINVPFTHVKILSDISNINLFDVRDADEVKKTGMMPGATNIPLEEVEAAFQLSDEEFKDKYSVDKPSNLNNVIMYSTSGERSSEAVEKLHSHGFPIARHYAGGWNEYEKLKDRSDMGSLQPHTDIDYAQLMSMIKAGEIQLFDVRTTEEVENTGLIPGATNIPITEVEAAFQLSPVEFKHQYGTAMPAKEDDDIIIQCWKGIRSLKALAFLYEAGFTKARHYPGAWEEYSFKRK